ncbi:MAG TPA: hypothetical protein PLT82_05410 [Candidatus Hydrogenedens sp.]|nr:hypothetical protein [Candidatus Hydrogenedens sp.]HOK10256.1 hypothetical protein [Candidatus Hydrogenedens sp.]HOL20715.1 hypothetical protein [Candidatus Hydrogenedens sp.]HPP58551.1 hypothetical protein [Candidatus Hydrogenedens sp.]
MYKTILIILFNFCIFVFIFLIVLFVWVMERANQSEVDARFDYRLEVMYSDGLHNSNSDLICWRGRFYLVHANSPFHLASEQCKLFLWESNDGTKWTRVAEFKVSGEDIRDPKFGAIGDKLFLYALVNKDFFAEPYRTLYSSSRDGRHWGCFQPIDGEADGWLFWRPKTKDCVEWYVTAYWYEHGKSALFRSVDGVHWNMVSIIHEGARNDETDFEFLPDGRIICTARLEYSGSFFGHSQGSTLVATSRYPYKEWDKMETRLTRLDGPCLFALDGKVFAIGRRECKNKGPFWYTGSIFNRKRTALYYVSPEGLRWLTDFPSAGDTSYGGVTMRGDTMFMCYYTSPIEKDYPWVIGMLHATDIMIIQCSKDDFLKFVDVSLR